MDAAQAVTRIAGIGRTFASHLRARGITTVGELRARLATPEMRRVLAWETGISERKLETWHRLAQDEPAPPPDAAPSPPPVSPEPVPARATIVPSDGLSGAESTEIAEDPIAGDEPPAEPPAAAEPPAPPELAPIVDESLLVPTPAPPDAAALSAPVDPTPLLRSVGRMRTFSLAVLAAALVTLATAISLRVPSGAENVAPDPLLSAGASPERSIRA